MRGRLQLALDIFLIVVFVGFAVGVASQAKSLPPRPHIIERY